MTLIDRPTNYYGVAFSIARLRHLLGWEGPEASETPMRSLVRCGIGERRLDGPFELSWTLEYR